MLGSEYDYVLTPGLLGEGSGGAQEELRLSRDQAIRDHQAAQAGLHCGQVILDHNNIDNSF